MNNERFPAAERPHLAVLLLWFLLGLGTADLPANTQPVSVADVTRGTLMLQSEAGLQPAPTLMTDVAMEVSGMLARVRVEQSFRNPGDSWTEAVYVFPLPEHAAVDRLRMRVGERVIEGRIKEREEAKRDYVAARRAGRKAGLVEQERPNIFTTSVANIGPGEKVIIGIEYQQSVAYVDGSFRLRFPLVVGPRYIPGSRQSPLEEKVTLTHGWAMDTDRVPDASRITPPVAHPEESLSTPVRIQVQLDAGVELASVVSSYHPIRSEPRGRTRLITLAKQQVPAERDFELVWRASPGNAPRAALFTEKTQEGRFGLLMVTPPGTEELDKRSRSRDLTLVIDTSGSMHGASIAQARAAVHLALDGLRPGDRFNLIRFANRTSSLYPQPRSATPDALRTAGRWVDRLDADGGTEMVPALRRALAPPGDGGGRLSQVVFITDGAVGNEQELFGVIREQLGEARLFTVGIGSAPNSFFMRKAARFGRGSFTYIGKPEEVTEKMSALLQRLEYPALTDIRVVPDAAVEVESYPHPVPDLYPGEPLLVAIRFASLPRAITIEGRYGNRPWRSEVEIGDQGDSAGVAVLWARRKIEQLMEQHAAASERLQQESVRKQVIETALAHRLVSRFTSLVAVDVTPSRPQARSAGSHAVKTRLPQGWTYEKVFGMPQTATPAQLHAAVGIALLLLAAWMTKQGRRT